MNESILKNELLLKNAKEKLEREMKSVDLNKPETIIQAEVAKALEEFCHQNNDLARAILNSQKTFSECCEEIVKDTKDKRHISDFEAYSRAVGFYMPNAKIEFNMTISDEITVSKISLMDLLR